MKELISLKTTLDRNICSFSFKVQNLHLVASDQITDSYGSIYCLICLVIKKTNKNIIRFYFTLTVFLNFQCTNHLSHSNLNKGKLFIKAYQVCASLPFSGCQLELASHYEQPVKSYACSKF